MEHVEFPKIARISRECVITEKIDGTNGVIYIGEDGEFLVGSRTRWLSPMSGDNHGFLLWAMANKDELKKLGPGRHYGEWWGSGIQRGYGLKNEKRFSLFNVHRWALHGTEPKRISTADPRIVKYQEILPEICSLVPELYRGQFDTQKIDAVLEDLKMNGSYASKGYKFPEGIVIFHTSANMCFKKTIEKDEQPKGLQK